MNNRLYWAKVKPEAKIPTKEEENAGYDIYACFEEPYMLIPANSTKLIPTGLACAMDAGYYLQLEERGSTGSKGIKRSAGVVDSGYRGEIFVALSNVNDKDLYIIKDEEADIVAPGAIAYPYTKAIAQAIIHIVPTMDCQEISYEELKAIPSKRGSGSLGSSGK